VNVETPAPSVAVDLKDIASGAREVKPDDKSSAAKPPVGVEPPLAGPPLAPVVGSKHGTIDITLSK
jgi:hypothetical protein